VADSDQWQWAAQGNLGWKRLGAGGPGDAGDIVETYLVCVKGDQPTDDDTTYYAEPWVFVCSQVDEFDDYDDWPVYVCRPGAHLHPWRAVWIVVIIIILKKLGHVLLIETKLDQDESAAINALRGL
jgi:hypothetical protein